jgi:hypothetical protein
MSAAGPGGVEPPPIHSDVEHPHQEFFAPWREARAIRYGSGDAPRASRLPWRRSRKRRAVVTIVHNEAVFLPIWLRYYSRFFAPEDIYVLDNDTTDGSTDGDGFTRVRAPKDRVDHVWMAETLAAFQHELLDRYDVVLVTDVDEIVTPLPQWGTLGAYIDRLDEEFVNPLGYEILHLPDREPALDLTRPILDQRRYWFANDAYDKPMLATVPMAWVPGLHASADGRHNYDPDLRLIHLHRMDYDLCRSRHSDRARRSWNERDLDQGWADYNRIDRGDSFDRWFLTSSGFESEGIEIVLERIPESWRGVV